MEKKVETEKKIEKRDDKPRRRDGPRRDYQDRRQVCLEVFELIFSNFELRTMTAAPLTSDPSASSVPVASAAALAVVMAAPAVVVAAAEVAHRDETLTVARVTRARRQRFSSVTIEIRFSNV